MPHKTFLQGLTLAFATDSLFQRGIVPGILRSAGATRVNTPRTDDELADLLAAGVVDVVIVDSDFEGATGLEIVRSIRQSTSSDVAFLPIIYLMANPTRNGVIDAAQAGVHEIVTKPYSARSLLDRLYWPVRFPRQFIRSDTYFGPAPRTVLHQSRELPQVVESRAVLFDLDDVEEADDQSLPMVM
ncbi:MAG: response regulator [Pseudomonadota bacterium]